MKYLLTLAMLLILCLSLGGCAAEGRDYTQIDQQTAKEMMAREDGHVIVDVRRQEEYDGGHIPGAILIPNESIESDPPSQLPDRDQIILIYCRSGNRSKQAAQKLAGMGYTRIYEFGGILTWTGDIVTAEEESMLIRVSDGTHTVLYRLNDSGPAKALLGLLPLDAAVENYGGNEKIFYPPRPIDASGGVEGGGEAGALALFSPWGNVVMYYGSFSAYPGLYLLGEAIEGADQVRELRDAVHVEAYRKSP